VEINDVLRKVRSLIEKAEHPKTDPTEANIYRERADAMMLKYAVDEALLEQAKPVAEQRKPARMMIKICDAKNPASAFLIQLTDVIARYCRCRVILYGYGYAKDVKAGIFGYQSDLSFFEIVYTTVFLHLGSALSPKWDSLQSDEDNIVRLHHMGLNWLDIARIKPDVLWNGDQSTAGRDGSKVKRTYIKTQKDRGEEYIATGNRIQWIKSFAQGYVMRIATRLDALGNHREAGTALVLANSEDALEAWLKEFLGEVKPVALNTSHRTNWEAWHGGDQKAHEADISGGRGKMQGERTALPQ
jgi:hypothetical protein